MGKRTSTRGTRKARKSKRKVTDSSQRADLASLSETRRAALTRPLCQKTRSIVSHRKRRRRKRGMRRRVIMNIKVDNRG